MYVRRNFIQNEAQKYGNRFKKYENFKQTRILSWRLLNIIMYITTAIFEAPLVTRTFIVIGYPYPSRAVGRVYWKLEKINHFRMPRGYNNIIIHESLKIAV